MLVPPRSAMLSSTFYFSLEFVRQKSVRDKLSSEDHGYNRYCTYICGEAILT